jgi:hypothetical protein
MIQHRRNEFDVTNRINTTDHQQVFAEVQRTYHDLFQGQAISPALSQALGDAANYIVASIRVIASAIRIITTFGMLCPTLR